MTFTAQIANYITSGDRTTELENGGWIKNIIDFDLGKYKGSLIISPDALDKKRERSNDIKGFLIESGDLVIEGIETAKEGEQVVTDICNLLALATMSKVIWYAYSFNGSGKKISVSGFYNHFRPLLACGSPGQTQNFLELCWEPYQKFRETRKLYAVIEYLLQCDKPSQPMEIKMLFISIVLESLKSTHAHEQGYEFDGKGFFKKKPEGKKQYMSFQKLLEEMLAEKGMQADLADIIKLRNEVFHNGLSEKGYEHMRKTYDKAQDIVREYLLRLLDYNGPYYIYSKACRKMLSISS